MSEFFSFDGPVFRFLNKAADLLWLNILTIILSIPIVTFGPAMKALAMICIRMAREEEGNITKAYFKYFKENFIQTAALGFLALVTLVAFAGGIYSILLLSTSFHWVIKVGFALVSVVFLFTLEYVFIFQARFKNKLKDTIKLSFMASIIYIPKTLLMTLAWLFLPACILFITVNLTPLIFFYGLSLPMYLSNVFLLRTLKELEEKAQ